MRIAFIVNTFPSGSQTFILNQITGLIDRGHDIEILATYASENEQIHEDVKRYNLLSRTCYVECTTRGSQRSKLSVIGSGLGYAVKYLPSETALVFRSLNVFRYGKKAASFAVLNEAVSFRDKGPYDIIYCHFGPNGNLAVRLRDLGAIQGKIVTTFHAYDLTSYLRKRSSRVYERLFEKGDLFLPVSERWKTELVRLGCRQDKITTHRMGIDLTRFRYFQKKPRSDGKIKILSVARLVEKKGLKYGILAVARILKEFPDLQYLIAGDGPLQDDLAALISNQNANERVVLLGWRGQAEIRELMTQADIFLAPSVTSEDGDQEGIPVVLMEAMAQGLPVISTYHSGIPELVEDGKSGFLVPERNVDTLAEKLAYLANHPGMGLEMGKEGRAHVERYHDIDTLNDQLVLLYQRLMENGMGT